jgi:DMSO/TMAO reductase YedYZ molybdopterin-dependent catalytic subunit
MTAPNLPPNQQLVRGQRWPLVGERAPRDDDSPWTITINGCVDKSRTTTLVELQTMLQVTRKIDLHCVTRWSKLQLEFTGVPLTELIGTADSPHWNAHAQYVSFVARSERNHSTSLPLDQVLQLDPLVALQAAGEPLTSEHGGPVRMVVPGKYFYKSVKWLERVEFLAEDRLGYWEAVAGYHNVADPWREERYMAATLSKQAAAKLIERRDFRARDLRSITAADRDLSDLQANGALLRDADFRRADLRRANFQTANLSNAHLQNTDLRDANFQDADLEGANLSGADLRGSDLRGASLFGASFCHFADGGRADSGPINAAKFDANTHIDKASLDGLTADQRSFVQSACLCE